jgi:hypothetical protein
MTDTTGPDGITAVLLQLADLGQKLAALDERQAQDADRIRERITVLGAIVTDLKGTVAGHDQALAAVAAPAADDGRYAPAAAPRWWKPTYPGRDEAVTRLRSWVDRVYRPGYGHLAAGLGECWEQHPLCLYILDWLSELWSVLYLAPARTQASLASQAEWHTRLLTAASEQLARETSRCRHSAGRYRTAGSEGPRP